MVAPTNYNVDIGNPVQDALQAYQVGTNIAAKNQERQRASNKRQQAENQARILQKDLASLSENPDAGGEDFSRMMLKYPQLSEHFKSAWGVLSESQKIGTTSRVSEVYSALKNGKSDIALENLEEQRIGALNSGLDDRAKQIETMQKLIKSNPDQAKISAGLSLQSILGADEFLKRFPTGEKTTKQKIEITKLALSLRDDFENKPIIKDAELINSAISRMDSAWSNYIRNPDKRTSKNALDQALIITFNKMLDPGSVVRESEYARTPQGQAAIVKIKGAVEKITTGGVGLIDAERKELIQVAKQLQQGQQSMVAPLVRFAREEAERSGIDPERVVGGFNSPVFEFNPTAQFTTAEEADASNLPVGTQVMIDGRRAVIE